MILSFLRMQESPVHAVKEIPANAGMTVFRTTLDSKIETYQKEDIIQTILSIPPLDRIEIIDRVDNSFDDEQDASNEFNKKIDYYNEQIPILGFESSDEVNKVILRIINFPETYPMISSRAKKCRYIQFLNNIYPTRKNPG